MARPTSYVDLRSFETDPVQIGSIDSSSIFNAGNIDLISALHTFLDKCREQGWIIETSESFGGTTYKISRAKTEEELSRALDQAQRNWDRHQTLYYAAVEDASKIETYQRRAIDAFAENESLQPIDWEAADQILAEQREIEERAKAIAEREAKKLKREAKLREIHQQNSDAEAGLMEDDAENVWQAPVEISED